LFEQALGRLTTTWTPGTHPLYRCKYNNWDSFTAFDVNCEGHAFIGLLGYAYSIPIAGSHPIYRCIVRNNADHMESYDANCEGQVTGARWLVEEVAHVRLGDLALAVRVVGLHVVG
ncbi:hypothetical protein K7G98_37400, partial [Saccharothrix sp. MB29]|nr:hypothetical protein [Saccharothrix sp. MB29]